MIGFIIVGQGTFPAALYTNVSFPIKGDYPCKCIPYEMNTSPEAFKNSLNAIFQEYLDSSDGILIFTENSTTHLFQTILSVSAHYGNVSVVSGVNSPMLQAVLPLADSAQDASLLAAQAVKLGQNGILHIDNPSESLLQGF